MKTTLLTIPLAWARRIWSCLLLLGLLSLSASAQTIFGLGTITGPNFRGEPVGSQGLIRIDPNTGASNTLAPVRISGVTAGQTLVGIDYRPANNLLYALGYDASLPNPTPNAQLYILDPGLNTVTPVGSAVRLQLGGAAERIGFDFNPTVDRIRVTSSNDANYRLNPNDGSIAATDGALSYSGGSPADPGISTVAYTNSFVGSPSTTLYDIDYLNNGLLSIQSPPNAGTLTIQSTMQFVVTGGSSPGTYSVGQPTDLGLDIYYNPSTNTNVGYLTEVTAVRSNGSRASNTYRLDLSTGLATQLGNTVPASTLVNFEIRDLAVALAVIPTITWNGSVSSDWRNAANWTPAIVPALPNDIVVPGGTPNQPLVSMPQQVRAVTLAAGAVLTLADGGTLIAGGNWTNNGGTLVGSGAGNGTVILDLNTAQTIGGSSMTVFPNLYIGTGTAQLAPAVTLAAPAAVRKLLVLYGNLTVTGQTFTLLSDAAGTAQVVNITGEVVGATTVQRYIDPSRNAGLGYRHYSAPVSGSTVADLATTGFTPVVNPAFNAAPTPNNVMPFPNVFGYDQARVSTTTGVGTNDFDRGYFSPSALSDALEVTRGYTVNIGASATVDFVGTLNNGLRTASGLGRGSLPQSGWHLRGNPYPSPIDWQLMISNGRLTNIEPALYVFKSSGQYTGSYASYINGMAANGGSNILPLGQGFFVRTSAPGASGSITFSNDERPTTYVNQAFQRSNDQRPQLALSLSSATASTQAVVYFEQGATAAFDAPFDAAYLPGSHGLTLATEAGSELLAINGQPALTGADMVLPLRLAVARTGTYTLRVDALRNLPANYRAYLRDALTGAYTDLSSSSALSLRLDASAPAAGRYALVFSPQVRVLATAPAELAALASVYPNPAHGSATLLLPQALRGQQATPVQVLDNLGRVVLTRTLPAGATEALALPLDQLAPGVYSVLAKTANGTISKRLVVE
ncbi:hypothetical protein GCM10023185_46600 [Hymenobacter saemangeumensis]|uniref:DUF4394 domain-containing protein n=1 Tax=Hymenobacter saemangeumensis TaxID=1084522 RepID=A0ABP8IU53_9BACT